MINPFRTCVQTRRSGQVLAIVAVSMVALLALLSLGIDLGMAYTARSEAQRVADAAALAGASVFMEAGPTIAGADARAREYAARNVVRNLPVDPVEDVMVAVLMDEQKVRVRIERRGLPSWFARLIGHDQLTVSADAAAAVIDAGAAKCLKPWAVVDLFFEGTDRPLDPETLYDPEHDPPHRYAPFTNDETDPTGWGTKEDDYGADMVIKAQDPNDPNVPQPGVFLPLRLPDDETQEECASGGGGGGDAGAAIYRQNICSCNKNPVSIGDALPVQTGNMVGPTNQGVQDLLDQDPTAYWDESTDRVVSPYGENSPRIVHMLLIGPDQIVSSGMQEVTVTNISKFFIAGFDGSGPNKRVVGNFFGPVTGNDSGSSTTTSLVKILRLVE